MRRLAASSVVALAVAAFLASLSLVTWRQSRSLQVLEVNDRIQREQSLARAEGEELRRRIHVLESRGRVVREAQGRLGMEISSSTVLLQLEEDQ